MKADSRGSINVLVVPVILLTLFFIAAAGFGGWAFMSRQDYKNNVDTKIAAATAVAIKETETKKDAQFAEDEKQPYRTYTGPSDYGSVSLQFPKTWSAYVAQATNANDATPVDGYWYPGVVPLTTDTGKAFALRLQVLNRTYAAVLKEVQSQQADSALTVTAFTATDVPNTVGVKISGEVVKGKTGTMIVLPLRDKTLKLWTEGNDYQTDFDTILKSFNFVP